MPGAGTAAGTGAAFDPVSLGIQAGMGVLQFAQGALQRARAKKLAKGLVRPEYKIDPNVQDNVSLSESELSQGMDAKTESAYDNMNDRALSASLDAILKSGGSANNISEIYDSSEAGRERLTMLKSEMRLRHVQNVLATREQQTEAKDKAFQINEWAPYQDKKQEIAALSQQGNDNEWKGLNTAGAGVSNFFQSKKNDQLMDMFFPKGGTTSGGAPQFSRSEIPVSNVGQDFDLINTLAEPHLSIKPNTMMQKYIDDPYAFSKIQW